jgi:hypothetical protein
MRKDILCVFIILLGYALGDMYLQNPRGSNDRLNEANENRNNGNRLFDSQNNAKGGYCYGPTMGFYEGSLLSIEWTNQHGCSNNKLYCNIVLQYMCGDSNADPMVLIRDGTTTNEIPDAPTGPTTRNTDANNDLTYGMHESYQYYQDCKTRSRNMGLWISDREQQGGLNANEPSAVYTRQNQDGANDRHGYECPEERDYYPYWAPSPWRDIAILTADDSWCSFYQSNSENVSPRGKCVDSNGNTLAPWNPQDCSTASGTWQVEPSLANQYSAPDCIVAPWSRDNHLGNTLGGYTMSYNWTLPSASQEPCIDNGNGCNCVLRIRYNISTADLNHPKDGTLLDGNNPSTNFIDWKYNAGNSPVYENEIVNTTDLPVQLAMDTTQFGRTFQDRSYVFNILSRKGTNIPSGARVWNLNVRGKRGNIVETYPATEYDFVPEKLYVRVNDYIHFQWTGCDTNPAGNAGEGTDQTDRSNIVQISEMGTNIPATDEWLQQNTPLFEDPALRQRFIYIDQDQSNCWTWAQLLAANNNNENNAEQDVHNCMKLNAAPTPYFNGGAIKMNRTTSESQPFMYMSSRNNNFSNRGQKAAIWVLNVLPNWAIGVVVTGAVLFLGASGIAGAAFYAKSHPHSSIANLFNRM